MTAIAFSTIMQSYYRLVVGDGMTANTAQAQAGNGDDGRHFAAEHARHDRMQERLTARLLDTAAITEPDTVLDIGCRCGQTLRAATAASRAQAPALDLSAASRLTP